LLLFASQKSSTKTSFHLRRMTDAKEI